MIEAVITGDAAMIAQFARLGSAVQGSVGRAVLRLAIALQTRVKASKLSGQVLRNKTGHLRASIAQRVEQTADEIVAAVGIFRGPTLVYGRAHEYGFQGSVQVREHLRTITQAFGRELAAAKVVTVAAHTMRMNLPERSFLRSALEEMRGEILSTLGAAVAEGVQGA